MSRDYLSSSISISNKSSSNCSSEDAPSKFFQPKLDALTLEGCNPDTITMLCEHILDLSTVKEIEVITIDMGITSKADPNAKGLLARRLFNRAPSVQKLRLDIRGIVGPFYNLGKLQSLRECTLYLNVKAGENPLTDLCQLLRTLPPLSEHDLEYVSLSFGLIDVSLNENKNNIQCNGGP